MSSPELPELRSAELFAALLGREVQFLVVGGIGAQLHGATRATKDLDVCCRGRGRTLAGWRQRWKISTRVSTCRPELGDLEIRPSSELLARTSMTRWITRAGVLDVLQDIPAGERGQPSGYTDRALRHS